MNHPASLPNRRRPRYALTFVDMVVAVTIMGIAAAVAVPRISESVAQMELRSAVSVCVADMEYLRRQAVVQGRTINVQFEEATASIISENSRLPGRALGTFQRNLKDYSRSLSFTAGSLLGNVSSSQTIMSFDHRGEIWAAGQQIDTWWIQITHGDKSARVLVDPTRTTVTGI